MFVYQRVSISHDSGVTSHFHAFPSFGWVISYSERNPKQPCEAVLGVQVLEPRQIMEILKRV